MIDYFSLQFSSDSPSFLSVLYTGILSFLLSSMIAFTYQKTSKNKLQPVNFLQALVLSSIVAATVMQAIGDSLARGLGMLGALAIIRFRTNLRDPRNIIFMFACLASGIACGVYGFIIAIGGTFIFCAAAFLLRYSSFHREDHLLGVLKFSVRSNEVGLPQINFIFEEFCKTFTLTGMKVVNKPDIEEYIEYEFNLLLKDGKTELDFLSSLKELESIVVQRFEKQKNLGNH